MRKLNELYGLDEGPTQVCCDVELFIRLLEWAREDSASDLQIHRLTENAERLSAEHGRLTMQHYEELTSDLGESLGMYTGLTEPLDFDQNDGEKRAIKAAKG